MLSELTDLPPQDVMLKHGFEICEKEAECLSWPQLCLFKVWPSLCCVFAPFLFAVGQLVGLQITHQSGGVSDDPVMSSAGMT